MNIPDEDTLQNEDNEDDDQNGEEVWLIIEDGNGLRSGADGTKPVELAHFGGRGKLYGFQLCRK